MSSRPGGREINAGLVLGKHSSRHVAERREGAGAQLWVSGLMPHIIQIDEFLPETIFFVYHLTKDNLYGTLS